MVQSEEDYSDSIAASVSPELKRKIRIAAAKQDTTMSTFVREALEEYMDDLDATD